MTAERAGNVRHGVRHSCLTALWLALSLSAVTAQVPPLPDTWPLCLRQTIEYFDDRTSDARTIGAAAVARCHPVRVKSLTRDAGSAAFPGKTDMIENVIASKRETDIDVATLIVLDVRKARR